VPGELFNFAAGSALPIRDVIITLIVTFAIGLFISFIYMKTHTKGNYQQNFLLTLIMLPTIIAIIILLVGSNVATAFSLAGAFSIIRFRSTPGDPKDITYVFFTMAAGLACGVRQYGYALMFTILLSLFLVVLHKINFGANKVSSNRILKIVIPEDLNYNGAFDDIFDTYTTSYELRKVKTTDLGTLFELVFVVTIRSISKEKEFLDALRARNGNLNIILSVNAEASDY